MKIFNLKAGDKIWTFRRHNSVAVECLDFKKVFLDPVELTIQEICVFFDAKGEPYNVSANLEDGKYWTSIGLGEIFLTRQEAMDWIKTKINDMQKVIEVRSREEERKYKEKLEEFENSQIALRESNTK